MTGHVATVQAIYAAFGAGDVPAILAHLAPDVEWEHDWYGPRHPLYRDRRGVAEVPGFFAALADWDFLRFEPQAFLAGGNQVAVPIQLDLRHRGTGRALRDLEMHLFTFAPDGRVARFRHFVDTAQFFDASAADERG
jgi:hypothetical protein